MPNRSVCTHKAAVPSLCPLAAFLSCCLSVAVERVNPQVNHWHSPHDKMHIDSSCSFVSVTLTVLSSDTVLMMRCLLHLQLHFWSCGWTVYSPRDKVPFITSCSPEGVESSRQGALHHQMFSCSCGWTIHSPRDKVPFITNCSQSSWQGAFHHQMFSCSCGWTV